ncbi:MAG TPA: class I SAM-dependent methyltransferase [Acidimicrobiales bacterium]|nr:class I SAM-dependent methyltransferase [Acidimicrobiales bacterium]
MPGIDDREYHKVAAVPSTGRPSIYELREPAVDLGDFLDEQLPAIRGARVLDAGCGPGAYVGPTSAQARELVAVDIAHGRLGFIDSAAAERVCGDVQTLPFGDASFDVAMAMHMLYHVPDIEQGVAELRRVIRRGGVLYAFTNSERAQWELHEVLERNGCDPIAGGDTRFTNENGGAFLRTAFGRVELTEFTDTRLVVTDPECVVDEIERNRYVFEPGLRTGVTWDDVVSGVRHDVTDVVERDGAFVMSECHGLFTCT